VEEIEEVTTAVVSVTAEAGTAMAVDAGAAGVAEVSRYQEF
jgi:hypothetical protein